MEYNSEKYLHSCVELHGDKIHCLYWTPKTGYAKEHIL